MLSQLSRWPDEQRLTVYPPLFAYVKTHVGYRACDRFVTTVCPVVRLPSMTAVHPRRSILSHPGFAPGLLCSFGGALLS